VNVKAGVGLPCKKTYS